METTTIQGVRFDCRTGEPRVVDIQVEVRTDSEADRAVWLAKGGVTGYESFCLDRSSPADLKARFYKMKLNGWWACMGTEGRWDALYIHGLQMTKLLEDLEL
ncbi:hypothetical protein LCGC14_0326200 [marine sediment metagenome]|uniref:Uncharacterized protein n=1 Tax=marine sediment metagenome TaxID=412755 RepID=A0A0F9TNG8_9ZZZZ